MSRVAAYRTGDVVLFSRKGRLFVHRVVEMSGGAVVTRGDSMLDADPPVAVSDVLGRVESIERGRVAGGDGRACERGAEGRRSGVGAVGAASSDGGPAAGVVTLTWRTRILDWLVSHSAQHLPCF